MFFDTDINRIAIGIYAGHPTKQVPNQGPHVIFLPTDFATSNEIRERMPEAYQRPVPSSPASLRLVLRNDGNRPWVYYSLTLTAHYEMRPTFPLNGKSWGSIEHVDEPVVISNCHPDGAICEQPPIAPEASFTINLYNVGGAYAAIEIPANISVKFPGETTLTSLTIDVGGDIPRAARIAVLPPNRTGQGTFIR